MKLKLSPWILKYVHGLAIGGAAIIPGVSGGTVAFLLGIYDELIDALSQLFKSPKQSILTLLPYVLGVISAVIALSYPISLAFMYLPLPTVSAFVGLIIGSLPSMQKKLPKPFSLNQWLWLVIPAIFAALLGLLSVIGQLDASLILEGNLFIPKFILLIVGFLGVSAFIVPGISGSMLLLSIGFYQPILESLQRLIAFVVQGTNGWVDMLNFSFLGVGALVGFIGIGWFMKWALTKHRQLVDLSVFGFILGSIFAIYVNYEIITAYASLTVFTILFSLVNVGFFGFLSGWFHHHYAA
jgi:putative membrane protein